MRYHADESSPFYWGRDIRAKSYDLKVYLDGSSAESKYVVEADEDEGWAILLTHEPNGRICVDPNTRGPAIVKVECNVRFEWLPLVDA